MSEYKKLNDKLTKWINDNACDKQDFIEYIRLIEQTVQYELLHQVPEYQRLSVRLTNHNFSKNTYKRTALISDIHGNFAGLNLVFDDIKNNNCDRIICLGDLVDGGNENNEVIDTINEMNIQTVQGNHDQINDLLLTEERSKYLQQLPNVICEKDILYTHISPRKRKRKIKDAIEAWNVFDETDHRLVFVGHVHIPRIYGEKSTEFGSGSSLDFNYGEPFKFDQNERYIITVGAVGYGRDQVGKIRYAIYDHEKNTIEMRALTGPLLEYDYSF